MVTNILYICHIHKNIYKILYALNLMASDGFELVMVIYCLEGHVWKTDSFFLGQLLLAV